MDDLNERHNKVIGVVGLVHVLHNPFMDNGRRAVLRSKTFDGAVVIVIDLVKRRHIHSLYIGTAAQEFALADALGAALSEKLDDLQIDLFAFSDEEQIDKIGDRLGVAGTGTSRDDNIFQRVSSRSRSERDAAKLQHIQHIGIAQLILQSKAYKIKFGQRVAAFKRVQRNVVLYHQLLHIDPRRENALAPYIRNAVKQAVQNFHA